MQFVATGDGTNLFYKEWGTGEPVIFVHGGQLGADKWEYQMTPLAGQGLRCIAYDRRGCGRSSQPGHGYDIDTLPGDLAAVIDFFDLRAVTLVRHSNGGDIARYLSRHGADRVVRAVLVGSTTPFLLKTEDNPDGVDKLAFDTTIAALDTDRPRFFAASAPRFFGLGLPNVSVSPAMVQWGVGLALQASPLATVAMTRTFAETDFSTRHGRLHRTDAGDPRRWRRVRAPRPVRAQDGAGDSGEPARGLRHRTWTVHHREGTPQP